MVVPKERTQPGLTGVLLLAKLLPRARAQWLQVEVDPILGVQGQLDNLDGWLQGIRGELKVE